MRMCVCVRVCVSAYHWNAFVFYILLVRKCDRCWNWKERKVNWIEMKFWLTKSNCNVGKRQRWRQIDDGRSLCQLNHLLFIQTIVFQLFFSFLFSCQSFYFPLYSEHICLPHFFVRYLLNSSLCSSWTVFISFSIRIFAHLTLHILVYLPHSVLIHRLV